MRITLAIASLALFCAQALTGCSSQTPPTPTEPSTTTTTSATATSVTSSPATTAPEATEPVAVTAPVTFECGDFSLYQSGTALYSDGTTGYEPSCDTYVPPAAKVLMYCDYPQTAVYTDGTSSSTDPACIHDEPTNPNPGGGFPYIAEEDRNGDGVVNGYERCGLACGQEPTSGDIQTEHGCEQGYITGPLCDRFGG